MSDYYQCEATSTTKDKTLAIESNLPMATMFIYNGFISLFNYVINLLNANTHRKLLVLLLLFILFGIFIAAIVNVSA